MPQRVIRWARVEYQPNLQTPVEPIPFGVVVEEIRRHARSLIILGREPRGPIPGLELENSWGPFREVVTEWVEAFSKSLREFVDQIQVDEYALDELARRWSYNVYLKQPESRTVDSLVALDAYARRWYGEYVGDPFPRLPNRGNPPSRAVRRRQRPWIARTNLMQAVA